MPPAAAGERLDRHVAAHLDVPRNQVQRWIAEGRVTVDGRPERAAHAVAAGETVACDVPAAAEERVRPEPGPLAVLYRDDHLLVVDKPAGLTVHPGAGRPTGTLVHRLLHHHPELAGVGGPGRPGIVHRLDKGTSGVMVVARTAETYRALSRAFAARRVEKRYLAVVYGEAAARGEVDAPIGRHPQERKRMTVRSDGRPARSSWRRRAAAAGISLLEVGLESGRTHQVRVHLKHVHHPLVGDPDYGENRWKGLPGRRQSVLRDFPRPALHAWRLGFDHPVGGRALRFEAPVPADLLRLWTEATGEPFPDLP